MCKRVADVARSAVWLVGALLVPMTAHARWWTDAPPLPPPDPGDFTIIEVDTAQELADACGNLQSNQAVVIAAGTYELSGVSDRLIVGQYNASPISNIQIRGATGNPADVVITGAGMLDMTVEYGFQIFTASDVLIADLSIGSVYYHAIQISAAHGAARTRVYHTRLFDSGQQIIKGSGGGSGGGDDVIIEYSELFLTQGAVNHPHAADSCYMNAIDSTGGWRWIIRDNFIHDIFCQDGTLAGPSVLMWQGAGDTVVERNLFLNCSRGVSLGLNNGDHSGGIVRNNFIRWDPSAAYAVDVAIYTESSGSEILHNTILTHGKYTPMGPVAVEVRYAGTTGVLVQSNLMDAGVLGRDSANPTELDNITNASPSWFVDETSGDLHLTTAAGAAIDQVNRHQDAMDDFDGNGRPTAAGEADIGAAELGAVAADGGPTIDGGRDDGAGPTLDGGRDGGGGDSSVPDGDLDSPGDASPKDGELTSGCGCGPGRGSFGVWALFFVLLARVRRGRSRRPAASPQDEGEE
ncbi:hypothetical protein ACFL6C_03235 [Myxococcota bacterium]